MSIHCMFIYLLNDLVIIIGSSVSNIFSLDVVTISLVVLNQYINLCSHFQGTGGFCWCLMENTH